MSDNILINFSQPTPTQKHFILTDHHLLQPTSNQPLRNTDVSVYYVVDYVVARGSSRSSSCRLIPSWRPLEMPRPSKMTTAHDL